MRDVVVPADAGAIAAINQRIFDTVVDLVLVVGREGNILRVSPSSLDILGYAPDEMEGRSATKFLYPPDLDATRAEMRAGRLSKASRHFECRYVHKDGTIVPLIWTGIWDDAAQQHCFIGRELGAVRQLLDIEATLRDIDKRLSRSRAWHIWLRRADIQVLEITLTLSSIWAAYVLFTGPSNFHTFPSAFDLAERLAGHESTWGGAATVAAVAKVMGTAMTPVGTLHTLGVRLRVIGLALSGAFWLVLGVGTLWGNPDTLFGFSGGIMMGVLALWSAVRVAD